MIATRDGIDLHVGAIVRNPGAHPERWNWSINFITRPTLPAPINGGEDSRQEAMTAFRNRWNEIEPRVSAEDWAEKMARGRV